MGGRTAINIIITIAIIIIGDESGDDAGTAVDVVAKQIVLDAEEGHIVCGAATDVFIDASGSGIAGTADHGDIAVVAHVDDDVPCERRRERRERTERRRREGRRLLERRRAPGAPDPPARHPRQLRHAGEPLGSDLRRNAGSSDGESGSRRRMAATTEREILGHEARDAGDSADSPRDTGKNTEHGKKEKTGGGINNI